jgi:UDP-glucose 4-epimerase
MYGECGSKAPAETVPANPMSPYGVTKRTAEIYLNYYAAIYGLKYLIFRYGNVYGPRQDPHGEAGVVAIFIKRMFAAQAVNIFGTGKQLRDYVYVGDVVKANLLGLRTGVNEIINIGTQKGSSVNHLYDLLSAITGYRQEPVYKPARLGELDKNFLNYGKAKRMLGWEPKMDFKDGLIKTAQYFRESK